MAFILSQMKKAGEQRGDAQHRRAGDTVLADACRGKGVGSADAIGKGGGWSKVGKVARRITAVHLMRRIYLGRAGFWARAAAKDGRGAACGGDGLGEGRGFELSSDSATQSAGGEFAGGIASPANVGSAPIKFTAEQIDLFGEPVAAKRGPGRPRHVPTPATRADVFRMAEAGLGQGAIAQYLGISCPTLRINYAAQLRTTSQTGKRRAARDLKKGNHND